MATNDPPRAHGLLRAQGVEQRIDALARDTELLGQLRASGLTARGVAFEILVVENGSADATGAVADTTPSARAASR